MKVCARCGEEKPASDFGIDRRMKLGLRSWCRPCSTAYTKERWAAQPEHERALSRIRSKRNYTPERRRRENLWTLYRMTVEEYEALLSEQGRRCAICRTDAAGGRGAWHVDHCHRTGKNRGLLCHHCNLGIGHMNDDPDRLRAAADYISHHRLEEAA